MSLIPALQQGPLDGYQTLSNQQQHVNFISSAGHVCELYYDGANWQANDLTSITGAPDPFWPYALDGYATTFNQQQHVNFIGVVGSDSHVFELYYDGTSWNYNDLSQQAGVSNAVQLVAPQFGLDGYETSFNQQQHVNFVGLNPTEAHVFELYYDGHWHWNDLTLLAL